MTKISTGEWLEALREASKNGDGLSSQEIAEALQCSQASASKRIRQGVADGTIVYAGRREAQNVTGGRQQTPVYRSVESPKKKGAKREPRPH